MSDRSWESAPKIVKNWAYLLTWVVMVALALSLFVVLFSPETPMSSRITGGCVTVAMIALYAWLNRALKSGARAAWTVQIVMSVLELLAFPLGTLIHGYILAKWFKPETKAWFGA